MCGMRPYFKDCFVAETNDRDRTSYVAHTNKSRDKYMAVREEQVHKVDFLHDTITPNSRWGP